MARFRPAKLFRRWSSRAGSGTRNSSPPDDHLHLNVQQQQRDITAASRLSHSPTSSSSDPASPSSHRSLSATAAAAVALPKRLRKSKSLPKLRKKYTSSAAATAPDLPVVSGTELDHSRLPSTRSESPNRQPADDADDIPSETDTLTLCKSAGDTPRSHVVEVPKEPYVSVQPLDLEQIDTKSLEQPTPLVVVQHPTPDALHEVKTSEEPRVEPLPQHPPTEIVSRDASPVTSAEEQVAAISTPPILASPAASIDPQPSPGSLPGALVRPPSLIDSANVDILTTLLDSPFAPAAESCITSATHPYTLASRAITQTAMGQRKIWVKRPSASATLVQIREDDLVDDVRDMILRKYANSLGKTFDAPDMTLSIASRPEHGSSHRAERVLGPEEEMCQTIDTYYPGGQTVDEALIINVPQRRTPRPSPKVYGHPAYHTLDDYRPLENGTDYFPPMPAVIPASIPQTSGSHESRASQHHHNSVPGPGESHPRSISVLNTGQLPPLPSPGTMSRRHHTQHRPKYHRQPTSSPTILSHPGAGSGPNNAPSMAEQQPRVHRQSTRPRMDSSASDHPNGIAHAPPPLPTPPPGEAVPMNRTNSNPPTPSGMINNAYTMNLHAPQKRPKRSRKTTPEDKIAPVRSRNSANNANAAAGNEVNLGYSISSALENATVPPINVLIVEDNVINLKILEGLMKRLKVRWQTAMNGQIAVDKYKTGGFHLVLMDIQMPVMNGLQATKEIRRLERVNGIGVFGDVQSPLSARENGHTNGNTEDADDDNTTKTEANADKLQVSEGLFKSPVIIVALTASSLQSDRHEALAAGCNDFLTKPVNFVWLERKVKEWGCMQALIDYDGWRQWKAYAVEQEAGKTDEERRKDREREEKDRLKAEKMAKLQEKQAKLKEERERERKKRSSLNSSEVVEASNEESEGGAKKKDDINKVLPALGEGDVNPATEALRTGAQVLKGCME